MLLFDEIIVRLKEKLNIKTDKEMQDIMGVNQGKYSMWKKRNKIPFEEITTLCCKKNLDLNYILNKKESDANNTNIDYEQEILKMIPTLSKEKKEIFYHEIKAEILKEKNNK